MVVPQTGEDRTAFDKTVLGVLYHGNFYCRDCQQNRHIPDACNVYGINIAPYSLFCKACKRLIVDGWRKSDGKPLDLYED